MSAIQILPELLVQILSRLPVNLLLRCRCVSKPWRALIDSDYFIKLHLNHSVQTNTNMNMIFGGDRTLFCLDFDSPAKTIENIANPLYFAIFETVILGSCNGLIWLCTIKPESPDNEMALWNPSIRKFRKIPVSPVRYLDGSIRKLCAEGFGYDDVNDDYKFVRLVQCCDTNNDLLSSKIEVFSSKANEWREVGEFPFYICYRKNFNVFARGTLHWLVGRKPNPKLDFLIAAFDLTTEEYRFVPRPELSDEIVQVNLAILGGCLCMVCKYLIRNVDVWVMKNYGVEDSWTKLISMSDIKVISELDFVRPIMYSKSGKEVLLEKNFERLYWYDLEKKTLKRFSVAGMPRLFITDVFIGSLVQVENSGASGSGIKKEQIKEDNESVKKRDDFLSKGFKLVL